jgi:hypothetical protein
MGKGTGRMRLLAMLGGLGMLLMGGCADEKKPATVRLERKDACTNQPDGIVCRSGEAFNCVHEEIESQRACEDEGKTCDLELGCVRCKPLALECIDNTLYRCDPDGAELVKKESCGSAQCSPVGCRDLCQDARDVRSYIGCEYWPVFAGNSQLDPVFRPAVAVANPNLIDAHVTVRLAGREVTKKTIRRQSVEVIELQFDPRLKGSYDPDNTLANDAFPAQQLSGAAYHLVSDAPVTVHQFNPLLFEYDGSDCEGPFDRVAGDNKCNSFTADASLLLPVHALAGDYIVATRASHTREFFMDIEGLRPFWNGFPGFVTVVGAQEQPVQVTVRSRAHTLASEDGSIPALAPGDELTVTLAQGEVLQLYSAVPTECMGEIGTFQRGSENLVTCDAGPDYDLTGTEIDADGPVQVIAGHDCSLIPFDVPACDHLEEALFPLETWGQRAIATRPRALDGEQHVFRVISGDDDNLIHFDPQVRADVTLNRGEFIELQSDQHVEVTGKKRVLVAQFLVGQGASRRAGDPAMGLAIPTDQYRSRYVFLSPDTYVDKFVNIIVYRGTQAALDGETVTGFEPVGDSNFEVATVRLSAADEHVVESTDGSSVGLILYGYADFTSYMLPAGLDLRAIGNPL